MWPGCLRQVGLLTLVGAIFLPGNLQAQALPGWDLVWADEFSQADGSSPNPANWGYDLGGGGWGNGEWQYYTSRTNNARIQGGQLVIEARQESYAGSNYTSARLLTRDKWDWTYGRMEARIKVPRGQGIWPAFWMLGDNIGSVGWPTCDEIDIMEHIGREPKKVYGTIHGPGYSGGEGIGGSYTFVPDVADDFRVFAIEWQTNLIRWYVDGIQYFAASPASLGGDTWVFDHPHFIILNVAVGGYWPGYPDGTTVFPQQMLVDYVRVYTATNNTLPPTNSGVLLNGNFETGGLAPWIGNAGGNANTLGGTIVDLNGLVWNPAINGPNTQGIKNPTFGTYSCKVYGDYTGGPNSTGFYQDVDALPGSVWTATLKARTQSPDHIRSPAQAVVEVSFRNAANAVLAKYASPVFNASTPTNTWVDLNVTQQVVPSGGTTNKLHAPPNTAKVRYEVTFFQNLYEWGSIYFDQAQLQQLALQATTLSVSLNGGGVQLSFPTQNLLNYKIVYKNDISDPTWTPLTTVAGDGTVKSVPDSVSASQRLYVVETLY
jgi:beta-glucanase (GH16 family)